MGYSIWEITKAFIDDHFELAVNLYTQAIATTPTTPSSTPTALRLTSNPTISPVTNPLQTRRRASTVLSPTHSRAPAPGPPEDPQSQSTRGPESRAQFKRFHSYVCYTSCNPKFRKQERTDKQIYIVFVLGSLIFFEMPIFRYSTQFTIVMLGFGLLFLNEGKHVSVHIDLLN